GLLAVLLYAHLGWKLSHKPRKRMRQEPGVVVGVRFVGVIADEPRREVPDKRRRECGVCAAGSSCGEALSTWTATGRPGDRRLSRGNDQSKWSQCGPQPAPRVLRRPVLQPRTLSSLWPFDAAHWQS